VGADVKDIESDYHTADMSDLSDILIDVEEDDSTFSGDDLTDTYVCISECDTEGERRCHQNGFIECVRDENGCLVERFSECNAGETCRNGICGIDSCSKGERRCLSQYVYEICEEDEYGFLKLKEKECDIGTICNKRLCCPSDMVEAEGYCIDKYEAIVSDSPDCATNIYGQSGDNYPSYFPDDVDLNTNPPLQPLFTCSKAGVLPSRFITFMQAKAVCLLSGKRLCTSQEYTDACKGGHIDYNYPYGETYNAQNCVDNQFFGNSVKTTGSKKTCVSGYGAYDLSGNVEEWVEDESDDLNASAMGGSAGCCSLSTDCQCSTCSASIRYSVLKAVSKLGFRCCR
jgi:hypothetical protein